jgi:hypothetical protein
MAGAGFHVHGPHDHELEHAAQQGGKDSFVGAMAVTTAVQVAIAVAGIGLALGALAGLHVWRGQPRYAR